MNHLKEDQIDAKKKKKKKAKKCVFYKQSKKKKLKLGESGFTI